MSDVVTVERVIPAPADQIFALLADASRHVELDGSGALQGLKQEAKPLQLGSEFGMKMKVVLPYRMKNRVIEFEQDRRIAWQSVSGSTVDNTGVIQFQENPDGSTKVDIRLSYTPPGGALGHLVAKMFGSDPKSEMDGDLLRLKTTLEKGRLPRDAAQPALSVNV